MCLFLSFMFLCAAISLIGALIWHQFSWNDGRCRRCGEQLKVYSLDEPLKQEGYHNAECNNCGAHYFIWSSLVKRPACSVFFIAAAVCGFVSAVVFWLLV